MERVRVEDHVRGQRDRDQPHGGDHPDDIAGDVSEGRTKRRQDQRELRDLRNGQPRQEGYPCPVAHRPHDDHHDQRIADQHEQREDHRRPDEGADLTEVEPGSQIEEEEQEQKIAQRHQPSADRFPEARLRQRQTAEERPNLGAETERLPGCRQRHRPRDGEQHEQLRRSREPLHEPGQHPAHQRREDDEQGDTATGDREDAAKGRIICGPADGAETDHHQYDDDVLHDQEADRDPAVQIVDLLLVGEQLDNDDRAGEGERDRDVQRRKPLEAERAGDQVADHRGERDLSKTGGQRHRTGGADVMQIELEANDEQQERDSDLRQQTDRLSRRHDAEHGWAGEHADADQADDEWLAEERAECTDCGGDGQDERHLLEQRMGLGHARAGRRRGTAAEIRAARARGTRRPCAPALRRAKRPAGNPAPAAPSRC